MKPARRSGRSGGCRRGPGRTACCPTGPFLMLIVSLCVCVCIYMCMFVYMFLCVCLFVCLLVCLFYWLVGWLVCCVLLLYCCYIVVCIVFVVVYVLFVARQDLQDVCDVEEGAGAHSECPSLVDYHYYRYYCFHYS